MKPANLPQLWNAALLLVLPAWRKRLRATNSQLHRSKVAEVDNCCGNSWKLYLHAMKRSWLLNHGLVDGLLFIYFLTPQPIHKSTAERNGPHCSFRCFRGALVFPSSERTHRKHTRSSDTCAGKWESYIMSSRTTSL